ncbi:hypothetical protein [Arthrobacter sp. MYb224]|uniref:hypothetical protein n=1 Tax=Arthrobacter sp. MYb224 TaxID=1848600 RepID=UPI000CFBAEBD|nr:hypothetical protein [Arthrobacter sp. MYb224]
MDLAHILPAGRRGRRLLWEFALAGEEQALPAFDEHPLRSGMFHAAYQVEACRGDSVVMFGPGAEVGRGIKLSLEELAELLNATELVAVTDMLLKAALERSVDAARYWQEPDGEDTLLASPVLAEPLQRIAGHIADSGNAQWWCAPVDLRSQFHVEFDQLDPSASVTLADRSVANELKRWKELLILTEARFAAEKPTPASANLGGDWWSMPSMNLVATSGIFADKQPLGLSCVEDGFGWEQAVTRAASVPPSVRILEISFAADWVRLCRKYGIEVTAGKRHDWYRTTGRDGSWVMPDWSLVAQHYDGVHLSVAGYLGLAGECLEVDENFASAIAGWDPDKTYWFTDEIRFYAEPVNWSCLDANSEARRWVCTTGQ